MCPLSRQTVAVVFLGADFEQAYTRLRERSAYYYQQKVIGTSVIAIFSCFYSITAGFTNTKLTAGEQTCTVPFLGVKKARRV